MIMIIIILVIIIILTMIVIKILVIIIILIMIIITSVMQSINGASLKEHWAAQHCLHGSNSSTTYIAEYAAPKL